MKYVRDGQRVWPYCPDCGCRLSIVDNYQTSYAITHYGLHPEKDARGCKCPKLFNSWIIPKYRLEYLDIGV